MKNKLAKISKITLSLGVLTLMASLGQYQFSAAENAASGSSPFAMLGVIIAAALIIISVILVAIAMSI